MLIRDTAELKEYAKVNKNMAWNSLKKSVELAEQRYLMPILDAPQYSDLSADLTANALDAAQIALLEYCRRVVANAAMYLAYPTLNVQESDMGIQQSKSREGTSEPAVLWRYQEARIFYITTLTQAIEDLYIFLQEKKADYPLWVAGRGYSEYNDLFIRNNKELGSFLNTADSVRAYIALQPYIKMAELKCIIPIVPADKVTELRNALKGNSLNATQKAELSAIRYTIASCAYYDALPHIAFEIGTQAIMVVMAQDGMNQKRSFSIEERKMTRHAAAENKDYFLAELQKTYTIINDETTESPLCNAYKKDFWV